MAVLARALLDDSAPGIDALTSRSTFDDVDSIGWAWFTRFALVSSTVDAVVVLAFVRAVMPPPSLPSWAWVIAAVGVGIGIAGVILRSPTLGWDAPSTENAPTSRPSRPTVRAVLTGIYAVVGAGLVVVLA